MRDQSHSSSCTRASRGASRHPQRPLRLFCFPYAGGGGSLFRRWTAKLAGDIEVRPVLLPGRESRWRDATPARLDLLVDDLIENLLPALDLPFAFFGHSLGALVSFEVARRLRRMGGARPSHLFVSAHRAPQIARRGRAIHGLGDDEFLQEIRKLNGTPESVLRNPELVQLVLPVLRTDFALYETYTYSPQPPLDIPITAFGGSGDVGVRPEDLAAWSDQTRARFGLRMFPGDHFFINSAEHLVLWAIAQELRAGNLAAA